MFLTTLVTIDKREKQPKCPLTDKWINTMWYVRIMGYYSASKRNEVLIDAVTYMNL